MPYHSVSEVPSSVPKDKRKQWMEVWNSAYAAALKDGKSKKDAEAQAFREANGVTNKARIAKFTNVGYTPTASNMANRCEFCQFFDGENGDLCLSVEVAADPTVPVDETGRKVVSPKGWCEEFRQKPEQVKTMKQMKKFIPFVKVDETLRQVWGIVTAELPDKEDEVCDYAKSKPYYEAVIREMAKATGGENFFPLREMHQLKAAGKCVGFEMRDAEREIYMGFKVVDDDAWKKVQENVYTGFSQGGRIVGDLTPDPVYKGCMRYVADPSECSLVDNPCLAAAHFAYVKSDGAVEIRKFSKTEEAAIVPLGRLSNIIEQVAALKKQLAAKEDGKTTVRTKRVGNEDLEASAFAYVGDVDKPETWLLPIQSWSIVKTKRYIRMALVRSLSQAGIPEEARAKVYACVVAAAKKSGVDVTEEKAKMASIRGYLRKQARIWVNRAAAREGPHKLSKAIWRLDDDLGRLSKGMYELGRLACCIEEISYMVYQCQMEQEWEDDFDSKIPSELAGNVSGLLDTLLAMAAEEAEELREAVTTVTERSGGVAVE